MTKLSTRILAFLLCIAMLCTTVPMGALTVYATDTETGTEIPGENTDELPPENPDELPDEIPEDGNGDNEDVEIDLNAIAVEVGTAEELELALAEQQRAIRITADIEIDRTFYITADTAIFTDTAHTMTREADFAGDIFVVGESAEGVLCENAVTLTLGHPDSLEKNLLTIDGNKDNMTVAVTGSVLFVVGGAAAELYENVTITNHKKVGNEKTLTEAYGVSYVGRVGGAVAIIAAGAAMDIYGGTYSNNSVNDIVDSSTEEGQVSTYGGAFYNFGVMNVYGGVFQNNHAARGGVFYCYRTTRIYNAQILNNTASSLGGAVYMPASTAAFLFLGGENSYTDSRVVFQENTAEGNGGAIYAWNKLDAKDTWFINNSSTTGSGGAIAAGQMELITEKVVFEGNTAAKYGGAIYYAGTKGKEGVKDLTCIDTVFESNSVSASAGALYMNGEADAYMENVEFTLNTATNNGGAIYLNNAYLDIDGGTISQNSCSNIGGAITATGEASVRLNAITGASNSAKQGGFLYGEDSSALHIFDSTLEENTSTSNGGAVCLYTGANGGIYNTTFHKNIAGGNGGALFVYTDVYNTQVKLVLHSCTYTENEGNYGGALYASQRSVIDLYNSTAKYNKAVRGGFLYHTTTNTIINLAALVLEGNTATEGGPIIWGNSTGAKLKLDKALWVDKDVEGNLSDDYWAAAIYNSLNVTEVVIDIPNYIGYTGEEVIPTLPRVPVSITSAEEMEAALAMGKDLLHITADFTIDRTFYIWRNTTIYSTSARTLTRAADFAGDIFVVGERAAGERCENAVTLTLGDPESTQKNLLTIDGNKANLTTTVTGSVIFVVNGANAEIYENVTITNHKKLGNEKTLTGEYGVSYVEQVGGAVAILSANSTMSIYGGNFTNNEVNDVSGGDSNHGGAIYNFGKLNIYGGTFDGNSAVRGAAIYCYRTTNIYKAEFKNNTANLGGAIYMPASTAAVLNVGTQNDLVEGSVSFTGNSAESNGGVIYGYNNVTIQNAAFTENSAGGSGGALFFSNGTFANVTDSTFTDNSAGKHGGAIYSSGKKESKDLGLTLTGCDFTSNSSTSNGGALYLTTGAAALVQDVDFTTNSGAAGGAIYSTGSQVTVTDSEFTENTTTSGSGGGVALASSSTGVFSKITATKNIADSAGGFLYSGESDLTMYRSTIKENSCTGNGGGMALYDGTTAKIYATDFEKNTITGTGNGGALFLYTNQGEVLLHSCNFTENYGNYGGALYASNKAIATIYNITATDNDSKKGGFLYETTTGTTIDLVGVTLSGNTATEGGPIIWGNSAGAVLNLDKGKWVDLDHTGELDSAYWAAAIVNKLTVKEISEDIPKWLDYLEEAYDHMADAVDVSTAKQLEEAIASGAPFIRVIADIEVDRTFYITGNTTIFSTLPRTLTRAPGFGGDIFVVGENEDGTSALLLGGNAKLVLGNPLSTQENLLVIDGNKENMTVPVVGSALFIAYSGVADLYTNVTVRNMHKSDNERTYEERYQLSLPNRIGGAMAVVASGSLNIYGGNYRDNRINEEDTSSEETRNSTNGGLIFNNSNVYIYGGTFENNQGARGGVMYSYRIVKIYGGSFIGNIATVSGGVMYIPNSAPAHTHIGNTDADGAQVLFQNNYSVGNGGVICSSALCTLVIHGNTTFEGNYTDSCGGAISNYGSLTVRDAEFIANTAVNRGGAVYVANSSANYVTRYNSFKECTFESNVAKLGGAMSVYATNSEFENGAIATVTDCAFTGNQAAAPTSKTAGSSGGALHIDRRSSVTIKATEFKQNSARTEGGAIYAGGASKISASDVDFIKNATMDNGKHGGAISIHSVDLDLVNANLTGNVSQTNGGALYISYASAYDQNSKVNLKDSTFSNNSTKDLGGAIYATKQTVTKEARILTVDNTEFTGNSATDGGAMFFNAGTSAYMTDTTFTENNAVEGSAGAIYNNGATVELDTATISENTAAGSGGALYLKGNGETVLYNVTATGNNTGKSGGFLYMDSAVLRMYDSLVKENTAGANAGGIAAYAGSAANIYATNFEGNVATGNGGALFLYTNETPCVLHSCNFISNSGVYGGAIYASNLSLANIYNVAARNNASTKGGFLYETTTGTKITLVGTTVKSNTATDGGSIIWGNSAGATLYLNKSKFTDEDRVGALNNAYWAEAIVNKLVVEEISSSVPKYTPYKSKRTNDTTKPVVKDPVPVQELFTLAEMTNDSVISGTYSTFPKLDNSSNFMSKNVTTFENINGSDVTVDTFVYPTKGTADNGNAGMGLLIWQAMCYKQAHPEKEVYIDASAYRFSVQAAVNISRNSRYFGYMRQLSGTQNYDQYGFVRIAYLLISAAKMGVHVNVIGHIDAYPVSSHTLQLYSYFTTQLNDPCDPSYVQDGVIGDYLDFTRVDWTLQNKGGTDMMHTKMCAVSHYLDMNGVAHQNAVWSSSANLDGINASGQNANWKQQTATIVSGHEALYKTAVNYLRLIPQYQEQEEIYLFQELVNRRSTQQAQMILEGRESEIPEGEQIIYLGRDTDKVFELYFTPMGGDVLAWDEVQNPYCKYLRKLYDSEDYILFTWNAAEYNGNFPLGQQIEAMIIAAFHENRNVNNRIYGNMESFDASTFDDLKVGVDIGAKSFNKRDFGQLHNKDVQFSYVEDGQRYYVSLLNSMNFHSGSMYYQSNFALVIKETVYNEDSVFFTLADLTTKNVVEHNYGPEQTYLPEDMTEGYTYKACQECDKTIVTGVVHRPSQWVVDREASATEKGIQHKECLVCGAMLESREFGYGEGRTVTLSDINGKKFTKDAATQIPVAMKGMPYTLEATIQLSKNVNGRGGVIVGNYNAGAGNKVNLEIYTHGRVRLYYSNNGTSVTCLFGADIRSSEATHIAVTIDGLTATLYVNGEAVETAQLDAGYPETAENFVIGGDRRAANPYYFRGTIYSVSLFGDARTAQEVAKDAVLVSDDADALLYTGSFTTPYVEKITTAEAAGMTFNEMDMVDMGEFAQTPYTMEAVIQLPESQEGYAGVIMGTNAEESGNQMYLEVAENGLLRLALADGEQQTAYTFTTDIRSAAATHIAVSVDGLIATLYVNGELAETVQLETELPQITGKYVLGGNSLSNSTAYFTGKIYSAAAFDHARTQEQIKQDMIWVAKDAQGLLYTGNFVAVGSGEATSGITFNANSSIAVEQAFSKTPHTIEATIGIPKKMTARAGVIVGNYNGAKGDQINLEVYNKGKLRLFYVSGGEKAECLFTTDIRSNDKKHIAVTIDGLTATLYVDGKEAETAQLTTAFAETTENFVVGGDNRTGNTQYFKGTLYSLSMFCDVRTAEEIAADAVTVPVQDDELLYSKSYTTGAADKAIQTYDLAGKEFVSTQKNEIGAVSGTPHTIEALVQLSADVEDRGGVIVGNYDAGNGEQLNLEIYSKGRVRLFYMSQGQKVSAVFKTDIRSETPKHIAVSVDGLTATLYVDGQAAETAKLGAAYTGATEGFVIGGDNRHANSEYFKGKIYSVSLFADVRTAQQIGQDAVYVDKDEKTLLHTTTYVVARKIAEYADDDGRTFTTKNKLALTEDLTATPNTIEATILIPKNKDDRAGVIVGNYVGDDADQLNLEVYTYGRLRLFYMVDGQRYDNVFATDIRSDKPVHIAVVMNGLKATLYVDGVAKETVTLAAPIPQTTQNFVVGGDNRTGNYQYFRGKIYSVSLFADARTSAEILKDTAYVAADTQGAMYVKYFTAPQCSANTANGVHVESDWIVDYASTEAESGVMHTQCVYCGKWFKVGQMGELVADGKYIDYQTAEGLSFGSAKESYRLPEALSSKPLTMEATIQLSKSYSSRAGVIFGNYDNTRAAQINLEIYTNGQPRLYTRIGSISNTYQFTTDIRSDDATHIAVTVDGLTANLYVNGVWKESITMKRELPDALQNYCIGGDNRTDNAQYFKGTIYSVSVFSDVRTAQEIACDAFLISDNTQGLLYNRYFLTDEAK